MIKRKKERLEEQQADTQVGEVEGKERERDDDQTRAQQSLINQVAGMAAVFPFWLGFSATLHLPLRETGIFSFGAATEWRPTLTPARGAKCCRHVVLQAFEGLKSSGAPLCHLFRVGQSHPALGASTQAITFALDTIDGT